MTQLNDSVQLMNQSMHSLVADKLVAWLIKQKAICFGARAIIKAHYEALSLIDVQ
jgi:hypothetical protein